MKSLSLALQQAAFLDRDGNLQGRFSLLDDSGSQRLTEYLDTQGKNLVTIRKTMVGEVHIDQVTNEPNVAVSISVFDVFGDFQGVLVAELSLRFMWDFIGQVAIENGGYAYIIDSKGRLLAHPDLTRVLAAENVSDLPIVAVFIENGANQSGIDKRYSGIDGEYVVGMYVPVTSTSWAVVTEIPWNRSFYPIVRQALLSAGIILAAAAASILTGILASRRITVPISHLTSTAVRISRGEQSLRADLEGPREISVLAAVFNSMTDQLNKVRERLEFRIVDIRKTEARLRKANTRLQVLIDHSPIAIVLLDPEGRIEIWSKAAESIYGWQSREVLGKQLPIIPPGHFAAYRGFLQKIVERKEKVINMELESICKDGSRIWISLSAAPLEDLAENVFGVMNIASDITEQKRSREQIVASLREKEVLLKELHHRVKNNMQVISSMLNLQEGGIDDQGMRDVFKAGQQRIQAMGLIHEQLYMSDDLSRIDLPRYVESLSQFLLQSSARNAADIQLVTNVASLSLSIETAVPCGLIINELLTNAIRHAFHGKKEGVIRIEIKEDKDNIVSLIIVDNGIGMSSTAVSGDTKALGLTLVRELVMQLHGSMEEPGGPGTVFRIFFPLETGSGA